MKKCSVSMLIVFLLPSLAACGSPKVSNTVTIQAATVSAINESSNTNESNNAIVIDESPPEETMPATQSSAPITTATPANVPSTETATNTRKPGTFPDELILSDVTVATMSSGEEGGKTIATFTSNADKNQLITSYKSAMKGLNVENAVEATQGDNWGILGELNGKSISIKISPDSTKTVANIIEITLQE